MSEPPIADEDDVIGPVTDAEAEPAVTTPAPSPKRPRRGALVLGVFALVNAVTIAAVVALRVEGRRTRTPIAALSAEVGGLLADQAETREKLEETRRRLAKQESVLATTLETVEANARRQREAEMAAKEQDAREARELAALSSRMNRVEKRLDRTTYSLTEALEMIDAVQGKPAPPAPPADTRR